MDIQTILTIIGIVVAVISIAVTVLLFCIGGGFSLVCALVAYIFNARIKEVDRRVTDGQTTCQSGLGVLTVAIDKLRDQEVSKFDALAKDINFIKRDITELRTLYSVNENK